MAGHLRGCAPGGEEVERRGAESRVGAEGDEGG